MSEVNHELLTALKLAKTRAMQFALVSKGPTEGTLLVSKNKIQAKAIAEAKKALGGGQIVKGRCLGDANGELVFEMAKDPPSSLSRTLKTIIHRDAGLTLKVDARKAHDVSDEDDQGDDETSATAAPAHQAVANAGPAAQSPGNTADAQIADKDHVHNRLAAIAVKYKKAAAAGGADAGKLHTLFEAIKAFVEKHDFIHASQGLDQMEKLLALNLAGPGDPSELPDWSPEGPTGGEGSAPTQKAQPPKPVTPNESKPKSLVPKNFGKTHNYDGATGGIEYKVKNGDSWESLAASYNIKLDKLIYFNFKTNVPEEVNWYLRNYVGCNQPSPSGHNWAFSSSANPGIIFIPIFTANFEPEVIQPKEDILERLIKAAKRIPGAPGGRCQKIMAIAKGLGASWKSLWYYNGQAAFTFVQFQTGEAKRREMTKATNGKTPFSGSSGTYGDWVILPFVDSLNNVCPNGNCTDKALEGFLQWLDNQVSQSVQNMHQAAGTQGGATSPMTDDFLQHVGQLAGNSNHLYSVY